jgi:Putative restriction endonuclease
MTVQPRPSPPSYEDLRALPPQARAEILHGEIIMSPPASAHLVTKRRTAQAAGVPEYWIVNPETYEIVRHTLVGGSYEEHFVEPGQEEKVESLPFPYTLRPEVLGPAPDRPAP